MEGGRAWNSLLCTHRLLLISKVPRSQTSFYLLFSKLGRALQAELRGRASWLLLTLCNDHHRPLSALYLPDCTAGTMPDPLLRLRVSACFEDKDREKNLRNFFLVLPMTSDSQEAANYVLELSSACLPCCVQLWPRRHSRMA